MDLQDLGLEKKLLPKVLALEDEGFEVGRVIAEYKERYKVYTLNATYSAEITGNLRFTASSREDFPAVGDWVKLNIYDKESAIIMEILERKNKLARQAVGKHAEEQLIATNVDAAFIVQAVGYDFNLNRLERYLAICHASNIQPIIVLSKTDLLNKTEVDKLVQKVQNRVQSIPVVKLSNISLEGLDIIKSHIVAGNTYCVLGSSGVGKSTLLNRLLDKELMVTQDISESTSKGRHTTSHRELFVLRDGGILIDTPGMRELGMTNSGEGVDTTFDFISELALNCKYKDCTHSTEDHCAVLEAVDEGKIDASALENYHKLKREQAHYSSTLEEKRKKSKLQGKMYKQIQEAKRKNKTGN
ncbi:ribosome small subunit-dependent GTPase A [Porifericola rhodea]|uniref:ribosome small subunit-dependent GTPase A n=1 Tax=Porifericola rhodea TaxID=930972 RepID=UPI0026666802|nr:ribosome small subunit-dependent GTPase A [Porifericola rhodea]WKN30550.1 ribosome small subunit-dependent GTPase A [Porifericola rhodea]